MGNLSMALQRRYARRKLLKVNATLAAMKQYEVPLTTALRQDHPWTNKTGDAEKSLGAIVDRPEVRGFETLLTMRVGYVNPPFVPYGIWLERAHAGAWSVMRGFLKQRAQYIARSVRIARRAA